MNEITPLKLDLKYYKIFLNKYNIILLGYIINKIVTKNVLNIISIKKSLQKMISKLDQV